MPCSAGTNRWDNSNNRGNACGDQTVFDCGASQLQVGSERFWTLPPKTNLRAKKNPALCGTEFSHPEERTGIVYSGVLGNDWRNRNGIAVEKLEARGCNPAT